MKWAALAWFVAVLWAYRLALGLMGGTQHCHCLGSVTEWTAATWVFAQSTGSWLKADQVPELHMFFGRRSASPRPRPGSPAAPAATTVLKPGSLRRVKIFADLTDAQLERFVGLMELQQVRQWSEIVRQDDHGDAMYLVLEGELRVRLMIGGKEKILTTLSGGEFFGEVSIFDQGPRSADVVANRDSILLRISAAHFNRLLAEAPDLAAPFLQGICRTLIARIRADNKRFRDSISFAQAATGG
jgi:hypothetical protein